MIGLRSDWLIAGDAGNQRAARRWHPDCSLEDGECGLSLSADHEGDPGIKGFWGNVPNLGEGTLHGN
jgi:hypothetical protein